MQQSSDLTRPTVSGMPLAASEPLALAYAVHLGDTVRAEYTLMVNDGNILVETTQKDVAVQYGLPHAENQSFEPIQFIVGYHDVIASIEDSVIGMRVNETKIVQVPPEKGFGFPKPELVQPILRDALADANVQVGFLVFGANQTPIGIVVALNDTHVFLDTNHPLAGKTLFLNLTVLSIQPPKTFNDSA